MRGSDGHNESLFSTVRLGDFVPTNDPLRPIRTWTTEALARMHECLSAMCEADVKGGRPSIAPETLVRALLLQVLYSVRTERQLVEQINYDLLFRRFVGLSIEDEAWNHAVFSKIRDRMIEHDLVIELFNATVNMARAKDLLLGEQVPALPSFLRPIATDNRHGLAVNVETTKPTGTTERDAAAAMRGEIEVRGSTSP